MKIRQQLWAEAQLLPAAAYQGARGNSAMKEGGEERGQAKAGEVRRRRRQPAATVPPPASSLRAAGASPAPLLDVQPLQHPGEGCVRQRAERGGGRRHQYSGPRLPVAGKSGYSAQSARGRPEASGGGITEGKAGTQDARRPGVVNWIASLSGAASGGVARIARPEAMQVHRAGPGGCAAAAAQRLHPM